MKKTSPYGTWVCKFCGIIFRSKNELWKHYHKEHGDKLYGLHGKGKVAWNKGLTKDSDVRVRQSGETLHERYASGEIQGSFLGKHHSQKTKDKCREAALKSKHQRVCKKTTSYVKTTGEIVKLDSSYELFIAKLLDKHQIEWTRPEPIEWVDRNGQIHHYFPDFFIPSKNIYLDPKNEYCFIKQKDKIQCLNEQYDNIIFLHKDELTDENILRICEKSS